MSGAGTRVVPRYDRLQKDPSQMRTFFVLIGMGLLALSVAGAGMSYDGSYVLFRMLEGQQPWVDHGRATHLVFQLVASLVSHVTHNLPFLEFVFSLGYASAPIIALALSWWVVRRRAPGLFIWAAFGVAFAALPGQICLVADMLAVGQLAWPLLLAALVGVENKQIPLLVLLSLFVAASHPVACGFIAIAAALAFVTGLISPQERHRQWSLAAGFLVLSSVALAVEIARVDPYEAGLLHLDTLIANFRLAVVGWPLVAIGCGWLAGALILWEPHPAGPDRRSTHADVAVRACILLLLGAAGLALLRWGLDAHLWVNAIAYRFYLPFAASPFGLAAIVEHLRRDPETGRVPIPARLPSRRLYANAIATVCCVTLVAQGYSWHQLRNRLVQTTALARTACQSLDAPDYRWTTGTALGEWEISAYSIIVQGDRPSTVVLADDLCRTVDFHKGLYLTPWYTHGWDARWFNLDRMRP